MKKVKQENLLFRSEFEFFVDKLTVLFSYGAETTLCRREFLLNLITGGRHKRAVFYPLRKSSDYADVQYSHILSFRKIYFSEMSNDNAVSIFLFE